ncbi:MAG: flagellar basal body P-ring formation chaperone FlgA [Deferribacterales bacterium]
MLKRFLLVAFFSAAAVFSANAATLLIDSECVTLRDIFPAIGINDDIFCGLDYGQEKIINRQMSLYIINKYGIRGAQPGEVTFKRRGYLITEDRLKEDLKNQLAVMYPEMDVEVDTVRMSREFYTAEDQKYTIDIPVQRFGNISVTLDNGFKKSNYSVSITAFKDLYVTTAPVKKGEEIADKVALFRTDLSKVHGDPITSPQGFVARQNISSARPVTTSVVERKPDAMKDTSVTIVYKSNGLEIFASGVLQEDAYEGKIVRVENTASGKIIRGEYKQGRRVFVNIR